MGQDEARRGRLARLALKIGTVAGAAAALLADTSGVRAADAPPPDRIDPTPTMAIAADAPAPGSPPPLVLKPSRMGARILLAGHRSHSSHSSHSSHVSGASSRGHSSHTSHVSGASHSSHFSSTTGTKPHRSGSTSSRSSSRPSSPSASPTSAPSPDPTPAAKPDLENPLVRYQLLSIGTFGKIPKAFIKDWLVGQPKLIQVGEKIGDSELISIAPDKTSVQMKPAAKAEFTLKVSKAAR